MKDQKKIFLYPLIFVSLLFQFDARGQEISLLKKKQDNFLNWKYGMFIHFNMGTFVNREWATGYEDPLLFNPAKLDCRQWAKTARMAGMKYGVLTVKHTGGWCLWDSQYTTHDITSFKKYKDGRGDIVREFVEAFRTEKLKVGIYYCLPGDYSTRYGNLEDSKKGYKITPDQEDLHGLPPEAKGNYEDFIEKQITELLTGYGKIDMLWFDQYTNKYTASHWPELKNLVHRLQPECLVLANNSHDFNKTDICSFEFPWLKGQKGKEAVPGKGNKKPSEVCDAIAGTYWFYNDERKITLKTAGEIDSLIRICMNNSANYLLNVQPNTDGLIGDEYVIRLKEAKKLIDRNKTLKIK